ncbi:DNA-methyltransferase [Halobacteriales archaeon Cl-PHB]
MKTTHEVHVGDARDLPCDDESVDLVVTSPPYPLIDLWDDLFADLSADAAEALDSVDGEAAFDAMHAVLDAVWAEVERVLAPGGIACVNVGDATRTVDDSFRVYPNHVRVTEVFEALGFEPLPDVLWHKPANSAAKFMGSGMLPPNAYVTLEHEYVLVFRKGGKRDFEPGDEARYESAFFWEERNRWFTDVWTDVNGRLQDLADDDLRERSAAFPFELPYRLINMYSVYGDTVLDPFWGTGTTTLAAMVAGRNSTGVELDGEFTGHFEERVADVPAMSRDVVAERLERHREFVAERQDRGESLSYEATHYDTPVRTKQERDIRFYVAESVERADDRGYLVEHVPYEE